MVNTILVTGVCGFIGSCFVRQAIAQGKQVVTFDKLTYAGNLNSLNTVLDNPLHTFIRGDIADPEMVEHVFAEHELDAVVHFAAETHVDNSIRWPAEFVHTNVVGTFTMLEAAKRHGTKRFLHVSTDEVYGSLGATGRFTETSPYDPSSPYSASKAAADHFVRAYFRTYGVPTIVTNCSNNFGPYQFPEKLIPQTILKALEGNPIPVYGDGLNVRDWLYVEDHCRALWRVLEDGEPGDTYNIGGNCEKANIDVVRTICRIVDELRPDLPHAPCESLITFVTDRPGHDWRYAIDASKMWRELGWEPLWDFDSGIRQTVQHYLDNICVASGGEVR